PGFVQDEAVSGDDLGAWQQRHTLGAAASDLALPSMVMVPEDAWMGIGLDHIPASLSPGVRFTPPGSPDSWPASPIWVPLADVSESLHAFVDATIRRATETGAETWAAWTQERWRSARARADATEEVRKWMYGEFVAERWNEIEQRLGRKADVLSNILIDSALVEDVSALDWLVGLLSSTTHAPAPAEGDGKARAPRIDWSLPPFREGYRLAQHARKELGLDDRPLNAKLVQEVLRHYGIEGREVRAHNLFRSAVWQSEGSAMLVWAVDDPRFSGQQPQRFSIAAALGRLLANGGSSNLGAAHSNQSRWRPTQLANAFAAEFLLPVQAIRQAGADVEKLSRRFGMSRSATAWHIVNRSEPEND
ncbi:MAG TPA: ImmA/IrrE family metallo-endopeptidase, partial [Planctomycetota bacterium]|nr:ImmA/IrrE family metallo-endopeptidase [Planctomycetota bacterium]